MPLRPGRVTPVGTGFAERQPFSERRRSEIRLASRLTPYPMAIGAPNQIVATAPENRSIGTGRPDT